MSFEKKSDNVKDTQASHHFIARYCADVLSAKLSVLLGDFERSKVVRELCVGLWERFV